MPKWTQPDSNPAATRAPNESQASAGARVTPPPSSQPAPPTRAQKPEWKPDAEPAPSTPKPEWKPEPAAEVQTRTPKPEWKPEPPPAPVTAKATEPPPPPVQTYLHKTCKRRTAVSEDHPKQDNGAWCAGCGNYYGLEFFDFAGT